MYRNIHAPARRGSAPGGAGAGRRRAQGARRGRGARAAPAGAGAAAAGARLRLRRYRHAPPRALPWGASSVLRGIALARAPKTPRRRGAGLMKPVSRKRFPAARGRGGGVPGDRTPPFGPTSSGHRTLRPSPACATPVLWRRPQGRRVALVGHEHALRVQVERGHIASTLRRSHTPPWGASSVLRGMRAPPKTPRRRRG